MTVLVSLLGGLLFFALIIASVLLHELGHLIPAKLFGVKVTEYFAGFGPRIWSTRRGETEYGFKWIPLGGYCKLIGMYPPRREGARDTWLQRVADSGREAEYEEITAADDGRLFYQKPTWQKLIVMSGGIVTNLILAFLLFLGVNLLHGQQEPTPTVAAVSECLVQGPARDCRAGDPATPAAKAGLRKGDRIVEFNGRVVRSWEELSGWIRSNGDREARLVVLRAGQRLELPVVHTVVNEVANNLDPATTVKAGFLGYTPALEVRRRGPLGTLQQMGQMSGQALYALATLPVKVYQVVAAMIQGKPRDPMSPMSILGASRVAGDVAATNRIGLGDKLAVGASLLGGLNLFLFWLNVVPLPPMDGGHIAGAVYEWARRKTARLRGRPDPGPFDTAKMMPVAMAIFVVLAVLGGALVVADLISPLKIFW